jgi:acyl carrier protein
LITIEGCFVEQIETVLLQQLGEKFGGQPKLSDSLVLVGVDSVGMAELTFDIEKRFGIRVDDAVLEVDTVQDLADYIRQRQAEATA